MRTLYLSALLLLSSSSIFAQSDKALLRELAEENKKSVEALALYPEETRMAILEASTYPEVLVKMNDTRQKTAAAFKNLIDDFPRSTQEVFFNLSRYPGLIRDLIDRQGSDAGMRDALQVMPESDRPAALEVARNQIRTLIRIDELDRTARGTFADIIAPYPAGARSAFQTLTQLPEVLEILNEDLRFTILVGDVYRSEPEWVIHKMDSLNLAVAREHAQELKDWQDSIEKDPEAQKELEAASKEYASEYGYSTAPEGYDDLYDQGYPVPPVTVVDYAYPWWFGYPWWYPAPCWRPYPWWYDWGFYYHHRHVVVVYMPSWYFMDWYFDHPHHHHHYSHLSAHFVNHYYGHRRSGTSISTGVGNWRERNRSVIPDDWFKDKTKLPERMREYGRFEESRQDYNKRNPGRAESPDTYLDKNRNKYPELEKASVRAREEIKKDQESRKPSEWAPAREPRPANEPSQPAKPQTERPPRIKTEKPVTPSVPDRKPDTNQPREKPDGRQPSEKPSDYHRQKWEESRPRETTKPSREPATKKPQTTAPAKKTDKINKQPNSRN